MEENLNPIPQGEQGVQEVQVEQVEQNEVGNEPQEQVSAPQETSAAPDTFKVKYNHEERELSRDEMIQYAQKGMNYDKVYEKVTSLENDPRLSFVESQAQRYGMNVNDYIQAVNAQAEQERINELIEQNIPESIAKEILENRKFREQYENERKQYQAEAQKKQQYDDFLQSYPDVNPSEIPESVWASFDKGVPLTYAYAMHENSILRQKLGTREANEKNSNSSMGSVTGQGTVGSKTKFTKTSVERMSQADVMANIDAINAAMLHPEFYD